MLVKELKITNSSGDSIKFGRHFRLLEGLDLSNLSADVSYSQSSGDGANYQRTVLSVRDFDLSFYITRGLQPDWWIEEQRQLAFTVFNPKKNPMRLEFETKGGESYYLQSNLESTPLFPQGFENDNRSWQKGLLQFTCDDPYIYSAKSTTVHIATWIGAFEFPLEIPDGIGIEMGYRSPSLIANVYNDGQYSTGMIIRFKALSTVVNPELINVNTYETFKLNTTMQGGDVIEVSTYVGRKTVTLIRNNVQSNLFHTVDLMSTFLQLESGDNFFRYNASDGLDHLEVSMTFTPRMIGV